MSNNNVINEKKKALLAYKEKILDDIKYTERSIDDFRTKIKNKCFYDDHADSSDSEDDFAAAVDMGPSITQLKLQHAMMKTCLHATQELTSLMVLQSEVNVLVEEPKFERERPVTEAGTWREVTVECRIDLVPFTMTFFMHTPNRRFAPPSYRGLRVVLVKSAHELELSKSVLHSLNIPSDAIEVLRSYAAGYRSRRTTLARLANKYTNALFMEPHAEGGFVLKCADLLEVSWRLENKWSPVAPFHHRMKFDLEFMEESYIKIITQAHKQLLDPAIQTDERTLLLAKIITTCLEARGTIDTESDLESKTTERDNDIDKRDSESEKRDSEVMAPPKSLPKKGKQKNKGSLPNTAQKRSMVDENGDSVAKKMKNDVPEARNSVVDANNARKSKINDVANEGGKKRKISEVNKVATSKNVKQLGNIEDGNVNVKNVKEVEDKTSSTKPKNSKEIVDKAGNIKPKHGKESENKAKPKNVKEIEAKAGNTKPKNVKEIEDKVGNTKPKNVKAPENNTKPKNFDDDSANINSKPKNMKESASTVNINTNAKTKNKVTKEAGDDVTKDINAKPKTKSLKKPANVGSDTKSKNKIVKEGKNQDKEKPADENIKDVENKISASKNDINKEPINAGKVKIVNNKAKKITTKKETDDLEENNQNANNVKTKNIEKRKLDGVANAKNKDITKVTGNPENDHENQNNMNTKNSEKKLLKKVANAKIKEISKETGNPDENNENENNINTKNSEKKQLKKVANAKSTEITKETGNPDENNENVNNVNIKNSEKKQLKKVANAKSTEITKETGNPDENNENVNNVNIKNSEKKQLKKVANANSKEITKETGNPKENNENNVNTKNSEIKQLKRVANTKSKENIDANKDAGLPKSKITEKISNAGKNIESNDNKPKNTDANKVKNVANTKNDDQPTDKKDSQINVNAASTKNDNQAQKASEKTIKNKEKLPEIANKGSEKTIKEKVVKSNVRNDTQTVKTVTEKNATTIRNKDKISPITKVTENIVNDKSSQIKDVSVQLLNINLITKKTNTTKNIVKKPIITHKIASHRDSLKPQNPPKVLKAGNTKIITAGNTEKKNGGRGSKIPQKALSIISEGSSKKNLLRISPRKIPSKFKTTSQETFKQKMVKSTNIPRLLKKPAPKTT